MLVMTRQALSGPESPSCSCGRELIEGHDAATDGMNANLPETRTASSDRLKHFGAENNPQTTLPTLTKPYKNSNFALHSKLDEANAAAPSSDGVYDPFSSPCSVAGPSVASGLVQLSNSNNSNSSFLPARLLQQQSDPPPLVPHHDRDFKTSAEVLQHLSWDNTNKLRHVDPPHQVPKPPQLIPDGFHQSAETVAYHLKVEPGPSDAAPPLMLDMAPSDHQQLYQGGEKFVTFVHPLQHTPDGLHQGPWAPHMAPPHHHLSAGESSGQYIVGPGSTLGWDSSMTVPDSSLPALSQADSSYVVSAAPPHVVQKRAKREACRCKNCLSGENVRAINADGTLKKKKHVCHFPNCDKVYGKTSHLRAHLRQHTGERPFQCKWPNCGKRFTRSDELQRHNRTHTGEKKFRCETCGKRFMRSDHLQKHLKIHQRPSNVNGEGASDERDDGVENGSKEVLPSSPSSVSSTADTEIQGADTTGGDFELVHPPSVEMMQDLKDLSVGYVPEVVPNECLPSPLVPGPNCSMSTAMAYYNQHSADPTPTAKLSHPPIPYINIPSSCEAPMPTDLIIPMDITQPPLGMPGGGSTGVLNIDPVQDFLIENGESVFPPPSASNPGCSSEVGQCLQPPIHFYQSSHVVANMPLSTAVAEVSISNMVPLSSSSGFIP